MGWRGLEGVGLLRKITRPSETWANLSARSIYGLALLT